MKLFLTPILLLTFNRPDLVRSQIDCLRRIKPAHLFISSDGPRESKQGESDLVRACRDEIVNGVDWPCELHLKYEAKNLGCGLGVSSAISWFFDEVPEGIILEDDCHLSDSFFPYCEALLAEYRDDERIAGISADFRMLESGRPYSEYGFIRFAQIWGWASWRRVWKDYDFSIGSWDGDVSKVHGLDGLGVASLSYWKSNFDKIQRGQIDTWDFQLAHLVLSKNRKFIHPMCNLVTNMGYGPDATHTRSKNDVSANLPAYEVKFPLVANFNYDEYDKYLAEKSFVTRSIAQKIIGRVRAFLKRLV